MSNNGEYLSYEFVLFFKLGISFTINCLDKILELSAYIFYITMYHKFYLNER